MVPGGRANVHTPCRCPLVWTLRPRDIAHVTPRPFPWATLPRATRRGAEALAALRGTLDPRSLVARSLVALGTLAGSPVELAPHSATESLSATPAGSAICVRLAAPPDATGAPPWWVVLEVEPTLVSALVARATKRAPALVVHPGAMTAAIVGSFAAIVAAALRRAGVPIVVSYAEGASAIAVAGPDVTVASFTAFAFDQATHVRAFFPSALLPRATPLFDRNDLAGLEGLPLEIPVVACRTVATASELGSLAEGDVWLLDSAWTLGPSQAALHGRVWLCTGVAERALPADLEASGRVVLREGFEELSWSPMDEEAKEISALVEAAGDVPVVVRVELGAARMTAKEWSALKPGDVVGLGSKIGGAVTLRVSGQVVAEGELVDLDGEVGVRIRRRIAASSK
jgi:flagellar motor switch/type III secretory pathway protein FliN